MGFVSSYYCPVCGREFKPLTSLRQCPRCSTPLFTRYELGKSKFREVIRRAKARAELGVWSFHPVLPVRTAGASMGEGWTPLVRAGGLSKVLKLRNLYLKNESVNPTGTFIDRGVAVDLWVAKSSGFTKAVVPALGDYAVASSAYAAKYGLDVAIYTLRSVEAGKVYRALLTGASIAYFDSYSKAVERAEKASREYGYYLCLTSSPTVIDGYRTLVFEMALSLGDVDVLVVPAGNGVLSAAVYKAYLELEEAGLAEMPRVVIVQSAALPAIAERIVEVGPYRDTGIGGIAPDLMIEKPLALDIAVKAVKESGGTAVIVSDSEMLEAVIALARYEGVVLEPAGAASLAGLMKLVNEGFIDSGERVAVVITGSSSKDPFILMRAIERDRDLLRRLQSYEGLAGYSLGKMKVEILRILMECKALHTYGVWKRMVDKGISISLPTVHYHIKLLESYGLIRVVGRQGRRILYGVSEDGLAVLRRLRG